MLIEEYLQVCLVFVLSYAILVALAMQSCSSAPPEAPPVPPNAPANAVFMRIRMAAPARAAFRRV